MFTFVLKRVGSGLILVFVISSLTFIMMRLTGTDVARNILGQTATAEQIAQKNSELGIERPVLGQYFSWLGGVLHGDLGSSWFNGTSVVTSLSQRLPVTLSIVLVGLLLSTVISVLLGVAAAIRGGWVDRGVQIVAVVGYSVPSFLVALVLTYYVAVTWGLLPATGYTPFQQSPTGWLQTITLPALSLAVGAIAATAQQIRGSMVSVLRTDYMRTLRSRGLPTRSLLFKHALRNAAPAGLTVLALQFIGLVGGAVVVEKVFGLNGIGSMANVDAASGDLPELMGVVLVMVTIVIVVNLLMDIAYGWLNPKVRVS